MGSEQYKTGTVTVTNGSNVLTFSGSTLLGNVAQGNQFVINPDNITSQPVYEIAANPGDNITLYLTATYAGATQSGLPFLIQRSFTAPLGFPRFYMGDGHLPDFLRAWADRLDTKLRAGSGSLVDADKLRGFVPSQTPAANQVVVVGSSSQAVFPGQVQLPNNVSVAAPRAAGGLQNLIKMDASNIVQVGDSGNGFNITGSTPTINGNTSWHDGNCTKTWNVGAVYACVNATPPTGIGTWASIGTQVIGAETVTYYKRTA